MRFAFVYANQFEFLANRPRQIDRLAINSFDGDHRAAIRANLCKRLADVEVALWRERSNTGAYGSWYLATFMIDTSLLSIRFKLGACKSNPKISNQTKHEQSNYVTSVTVINCLVTVTWLISPAEHLHTLLLLLQQSFFPHVCLCNCSFCNTF